MADTKISDLTALGATPASGDLIPIVDVSDTTMSADGTTKYVTYGDLGITAGGGKATLFHIVNGGNTYFDTSTTETSIVTDSDAYGSLAVPANTLEENDALMFHFWGDFNSNIGSPGTVTLRLKVNGTTIGSRVATLPVSTEWGIWTLDAPYYVRIHHSVLTPVLVGSWRLQLFDGSGLISTQVANYGSDSGFDLTEINTFDLTAQFSVSDAAVEIGTVGGYLMKL